MGSAENQITLLRDALLKLAITIGTNLVPIIGGMAAAFIWVVDAVQTFLASNTLAGNSVLHMIQYLFVIVAVIGLAVAAFATWKAASVAVTMALRFLNVEAFQTAIAAKLDAKGITKVTAANWLWAASSIGAATALKGLKHALSALMTKMVPLLVLSLVLEGVLWGIQKMWGDGAPGMEGLSDLKGLLGAQKKQQDTLGLQMKKLGAGATGLSDSAGMLDSAVEKWVKSIKSSAPMLPHKGLALMRSRLQQGMDAGKIGNKGLVQSQLELVEAVFNAKGRVPIEQLKKAQAAWSLLGNTVALTHGPSKKLTDALKAGGNALNDFQKNSHLLATTAQLMKIGTDGYGKSLAGVVRLNEKALTSTQRKMVWEERQLRKSQAWVKQYDTVIKNVNKHLDMSALKLSQTKQGKQGMGAGERGFLTTSEAQSRYNFYKNERVRVLKSSAEAERHRALVSVYQRQLRTQYGPLEARLQTVRTETKAHDELNTATTQSAGPLYIKAMAKNAEFAAGKGGDEAGPLVTPLRKIADHGGKQVGLLRDVKDGIGALIRKDPEGGVPIGIGAGAPREPG